MADLILARDWIYQRRIKNNDANLYVMCLPTFLAGAVNLDAVMNPDQVNFANGIFEKLTATTRDVGLLEELAFVTYLNSCRG